MARDVILRFLSDTTGLKKGFSEASKGARDTETVFGRLEEKLSGISTSGVAAAAGMAGVATSVVAFATEAVNRLGEQQKAMAQTEAVIRSTGGAANVTAAHVQTMAAQLAKMSGVDDEVIHTGENMIATFTTIQNRVGAGNDIFDQATKSALNMSVALGEDMTAASLQLGKALNDPVAGVTALRRVGVQLTDQQKASIAAFVASGDVLSAQKVILQEVNREFGGSAEAYGKTLPGAIGRAKTAVEDWSASVAERALPAIQTFADKAVALAKAVGPPLLSALKGAGEVILSVGKFAKDHAGFVVAAAAAYTVSLVPALLTTVKAFALLNLEKVGVVIGLLIGKVRALAEAEQLLNASLGGLGIGAVVIGFGALATELINNKRHADEFKASLSAGLDLKSADGLVAEAKRIGDQLATNEAQYKSFGGTAKRVLTGIGEGFNPGGEKVVADNVANHKILLAAQDDVLTSLKQYNDNVGASSKELGINGDAVKRLAAANNIDLTGSLDTTTGALRDAYQAQLAATKGWTVYGLSAEDAVKVQEDLKKAFEGATDPVKVFTSGLAAAQAAAKDAGKTDADRIRGNAKDARDALDARHQAEKDALDGEFITGKASKAAHDQRVKDLDSRQKAENKAADVTVAAEDKRAQAIESTNTKTTLSMEAYRKLIEQNTKDTAAWMKNLAIIAARGGGDFVDVLSNLGPEQAGLIAQIASSNRPEFDKFATTMRGAGKTAVDATADELNKLPGQVQTVAKTSGQVFADTLLAQVVKGLKPLAGVVALAAQDALVAANAATAAHYAGLAKDRPPSGPSDPLPGPKAGPPVPAPGTLITQPAQGPVPASSHPPVYALPAFAIPHAEGHVAQIAPAGSWRVWAEPETGGEAYIPLAASKRSGSMSLLSQVAGQFGQAVVPMAAGGMWGVPVRNERRSSGQAPAVGQIVFNEKVDPLHVARQIAWAAR
jgi:hypothetical protein